MKPGRELDTLVAEKVMDWTQIKIDDPEAVELLDTYSHIMTAAGKLETVDALLQGVWTVDGEVKPDVPDYSTDIAAAWKVVEKLTNDSWIELFNKKYRWECYFWPYDKNKTSFDGMGRTAPHAICLAALKSLGIEVVD